MNAPRNIHRTNQSPPRVSRVLPPALLLALLVPAASAAPAVPPTLTGEWYAGYAYPRATYAFGSDAFQEATSTARRLVLRPDGTYELTRLERATIPGSFGMSTSMISCESMSVNWERGTFRVSGGTLTLQPAASKGVNGASPHELNRGCTRFAGIRSDGKDLTPRTSAWKVAGGALVLTARDARTEYRRATPEELARANTPPPSPAPVTQTPRSPAPPPVRADAAGRWEGRFTADGGAPLDVRLNVEDDRLGIQGVVLSQGEQYLGTVRGEYGAGTLTLTLSLPDDTSVELRAEGTFAGNTFSGRFRAFSEAQPVGGGTVRLERR